MSKIFAIDLGNKQSKLKSEKDIYVLPSVLVNKRDVQSVFSVSKPDGIVDLKINGSQNTYYWGSGVLNYDQNKLMDSLGFGGRYNRTIYRLLNEFALAILGRDWNSNDDLNNVHVVVGLPTGDYTKETIDTVKSIFLDKQGNSFAPKSHLITVDNQEVIVKVSKVTTLPQPIGTFYNLVINDYGDIVEPDLVSKRLAIADIGGGTALLDQIMNSNLDATYRTQLETGANTLYSQIRTVLMQEYGLNADLHKIEILIRKALEIETLKDAQFIYVQSDTNTFDISEVVRSEIRHYTESLANNIYTTFQNLNEVDLLVVTGGTANIIDKTIFEQSFGNQTKVVFTNNSEFANVSGFYKYALLRED